MQFRDIPKNRVNVIQERSTYLITIHDEGCYIVNVSKLNIKDIDQVVGKRLIIDERDIKTGCFLCKFEEIEELARVDIIEVERMYLKGIGTLPVWHAILKLHYLSSMFRHLDIGDDINEKICFPSTRLKTIHNLLIGAKRNDILYPRKNRHKAMCIAQQ